MNGSPAGSHERQPSLADRSGEARRDRQGPRTNPRACLPLGQARCHQATHEPLHRGRCGARQVRHLHASFRCRLTRPTASALPRDLRLRCHSRWASFGLRLRWATIVRVALAVSLALCHSASSTSSRSDSEAVPEAPKPGCRRRGRSRWLPVDGGATAAPPHHPCLDWRRPCPNGRCGCIPGAAGLPAPAG